MFIRCLLVAGILLMTGITHAQTPATDSSRMSTDELAMDTTIDYEDFFNEFEQFLESILSPRSYLLANVGVSQGYYNFSNKTNSQIETSRRYTFSPTLGYYDKSGWGFTMAGKMIRAEDKMNLYQVSLSPSYDYLQDRNVAAGISYLRYLTKDSLSFYVSPLQNELNAYFLWRQNWLQTGISASYGWGSRTDYEKRLKFLRRLRRRALIVTTTEESISDFSLTATVKHDFYWLNNLSPRDYIKLTPQLAFSGGTQKFGFNQTTGTYGMTRLNIFYNAGSVNLDDEVKFQPLSLTLYLRGEYSIGKFFVQPQVLFDYYFPATENNFATLFSINAGLVF